MKYLSLAVSLSQSLRSHERSTSSAVQKLAWAFLYIFQMFEYWMGRITNLLGFSVSKGSTDLFFCNFFLGVMGFCLLMEGLTSDILRFSMFSILVNGILMLLDVV